jgi:hypothetical protein
MIVIIIRACCLLRRNLVSYVHFLSSVLYVFGCGTFDLLRSFLSFCLSLWKEGREEEFTISHQQQGLLHPKHHCLRE